LYPDTVKRPAEITRPTKLRSIYGVAAGIALISLTLTGCYNGQQATTNVQATQPSGNGNTLRVGDIVVDNATAVQDEAGNATVLMRITNQGTDPDALVAAVLGEQPATLTPGPVEIGPGESISFAWDATHFVNLPGLNADMSSYVPLGLQFAIAGITESDIMIVPPTGIYAGIMP
jgi:hypothetical protein